MGAPPDYSQGAGEAVDRQNSAIFLPVGKGKDSFIGPRDIGACAAKLLTTSGHDGRIYEITGSEHLNYAQATDKISAAIGKKVSYQNIPEETMRQGLLGTGVPAPTAESFTTFFSEVRNGKIYSPTSAVADLLGRQPRSLEEWARDNAAALKM